MALYGAGKAPAVPANADGTTVTGVTENGGAVGGTNDGDMPDISTVSAAYSQAEVTAIRDAVREVAQMVNDLIAHLNDGRT